MPQQQSSVDFFQNGSDHEELSVVLRGYDRQQVDSKLQRLNAQLQQASQAREEAEGRLAEAQRRVRQAEQRLGTMEQKLSDTNKQLEENNRPTLSGLGTRVEQILRLAEEQANDHRGEAKRESEGIISAARLEAREITDKARAESAAMKATAEREAGNL
ncbi:cell division protein DivIVA, partial [Dactylosporangium sp. NPDC000555]